MRALSDLDYTWLRFFQIYLLGHAILLLMDWSDEATSVTELCGMGQIDKS